MEECVFCKIVAKKRDAHIIYEEKEFMAFLDIRPRNKGHSLVIPKSHYRWVDDVPDFGEFFQVTKKVGRAIKNALGAKWMQYFTIGEAVAHAHVHVLPRYKGDVHGALPDLSFIEELTLEEMQETASRIKKEIGT